MGVNRVIYNGEVLIDTSNTTVTPATLAKGITAIDAAGNVIVGEMEMKQSKQLVTPTSDITALSITIAGYDSAAGITEIYKNGFRLDSSEYSISGKNVTFADSVEAGNTIEVIYTYLGV